MVETQEISPGITRFVQCAHGHRTMDQLTGEDIQCKIDGNWNTFPTCAGDLSTLFFFF